MWRKDPLAPTCLLADEIAYEGIGYDKGLCGVKL